MIYLDNAATTPIDMEVLEAMLPYLVERYGNPGGIYRLGREANAAVENARVQVAEFIGSKPEQILFTSGGSEGNTTVFFGLRPHLEKIGRKKLVVSAIEHDSVLNAAKAMYTRHGFQVDKILPQPNGRVGWSEVAPAIRKDTGLVSVMMSNNETGVSNPDIMEIAAESHANGALFHTDAVQAAGFEAIDVSAINCDFLTVSSHKLYGPKGVGALYAKDRTPLSSVIFGGGNQEFGLRGGTENVAGIVGFGKACELAKRDLAKNRMQIERAATAFLIALSEKLDGSCVRNGIPDTVNNKTVSSRFEGVDAESLLLLLDGSGICASAGSACSSMEHKPSHVLTAMGLTAEEARSSVRFSFSKNISVEQAAEAASVVANCVATLRRMI